MDETYTTHGKYRQTNCTNSSGNPATSSSPSSIQLELPIHHNGMSSKPSYETTTNPRHATKENRKFGSTFGSIPTAENDNSATAGISQKFTMCAQTECSERRHRYAQDEWTTYSETSRKNTEWCMNRQSTCAVRDSSAHSTLPYQGTIRMKPIAG